MPNDELPTSLGSRARCRRAPRWPIPDPQIQQALESVDNGEGSGRYQGRHAEPLEDSIRSLHTVDFLLARSSGTCGVELGRVRLTADHSHCCSEIQ